MEPIFRAYCNSDKCNPKTVSRNILASGVFKSVPKTTVNCKDCGSVLFWKKNKCNRKRVARKDRKDF